MTNTTTPFHRKTKAQDSQLVTVPKPLSEKPWMVLLFIMLAFLLGALWTEVRYLKRGKGTTPEATTGQPTVPQPNQPQAGTSDEVPRVNDKDHVRGNRNAQIFIIEYSDLECPFCKNFHPTVQRALDEYKGKVAWVYRHYPLPFHANAQEEAVASECAAEVGGNDAFWKYIDTLFERTTSNGTGFALDKLIPLAKELGLDEKKFQTCFDAKTYDQHIADDMGGGQKAGVNGTPGTILFNTKTNKTSSVSGAVPYEQLQQAIDALLSES